MDPFSVIINILPRIAERINQIRSVRDVYNVILEIVYPSLCIVVGRILSIFICSFIMVAITLIIGLIELYNSKLIYPLLVICYVIYGWYIRLQSYSIES